MRSAQSGQVAGGALCQRALSTNDVIANGRHLNACLVLARAEHLRQDVQLLIPRAQLQICATCSHP